jgi:hypothetical protein
MTGIFIYLKHVADLLDRCYEREATLHAHRLHSFAPLLRLDEQLAASPEELAEHRAFLRDRYRHYIWPDKEADAAFVIARDGARRRAVESGNVWESQMSALLRRRMKMMVQKDKQFREMFALHKNARAELFEEEVRGFSTELCVADDWRGQKNTAFCKTVFASQEAVTGLTLDRKLSTKASPTYSKILAQHWKVSIHVDGKHLNGPFGGSSSDPETGEISYHGPWVDASMSIRPVKPSTEELKKSAMFQFEWVFPVPHYYHFMCRTLRELEAAIRIYIEMFRLIEPELEAALVKENADRAA